MTTQKRSKEEILKNYPQSLDVVLYYHRTFVLQAMDTYASQFIQEIEYWKKKLSDCENMNQMSGREGAIK